MPAATSRNLSVHTPAASARLIRELTENLRTGRANDVKNLPSFLTAVSPGDVDPLLQALTEAIETPCARTRHGAYRIAVSLFKALPPNLIAPHALPLARALRQSNRPVANLALAACVTSIAPLRAGSADADALVAGVVDLASVRVDLVDITALRPSLIVALSCLTAAPSLIRSRIDALRDACWNRGFHSPCENTRSISVKVAARVVLAYSLKTREAAAAKILVDTVTALERILRVLIRYAPERKTGEKEAADPKIDKGDGELNSLDEDDLLARFESLSQLALDILRSPVPIVLRYPLSRIVDTFISSLHVSVIDPLAISQLPPALAPERVLAILPHIHATALRTLSAILRHVGRVEALPFLPSVVSAVGDALLDNAVSEDSSSQRTLAAACFRSQLYDTTAALGRISPAATVELARALAAAIKADIKLLVKLREVRSKAINAAVGDGRTDGSALGGAARKRRRSNKAGQAAHRFATTGAATANDDLGEQARVVVFEAAMAGARAAGVLLSSGVLVDSGTQLALRSLENSLEQIVILTSEGTNLFSATILAGGSGVTRAKACPLLRSALVGLPRWKRNAVNGSSIHAPMVMAAVDAILHPRAVAPDSMESVVRSGAEKPSETGGSVRIHARTIPFENSTDELEKEETEEQENADDKLPVMNEADKAISTSEPVSKKRKVSNEDDQMETEGASMKKAPVDEVNELVERSPEKDKTTVEVNEKSAENQVQGEAENIKKAPSRVQEIDKNTDVNIAEKEKDIEEEKEEKEVQMDVDEDQVREGNTKEKSDNVEIAQKEAEGEEELLQSLVFEGSDDGGDK